MKKIFSIFLISCATYACANNTSVFEESEEEQRPNYASFLAEGSESEEERDDERQITEANRNWASSAHRYLAVANTSTTQRRASMPKLRFEEQRENRCLPSTSAESGEEVSWKSFDATFGKERITLRFPSKPQETEESNQFTASAKNEDVTYSFNTYLTPVGEIDANEWFHTILSSLDANLKILSQETSLDKISGYWYLDYETYDYANNNRIKTHAVVTPYNAYTLQCITPQAQCTTSQYEYFLNNFQIRSI